ncbi:acyl-CoA dehydrogenase family protein [Neptuniibacter sp. 2_MG-2023]|jgi:alkylation response protein AidB-like acyl-CoA dehydrogenase|uniref:acyl-CoA dehydrogenase family protein n=1 Tax=Neptuniibacter sp. 2_MG-2023 TaxID=3062671 RepID=UPI0026E13CA7|nr:acyl-CoA dehydrogenase family protein [Neptuniibacter sp. 2_MG-2023]MDO6513633.1 acyl-CoA dehydrogenase family protein [Neptuniibacter sp. 2_MG-2023]
MNSVAVSSITAPTATTARWADDAKVLADVGLAAQQQLAPAAKRIDEGYYPLDIMASLGQAGAYAGHLDQHGCRFDLSISAMSEISRHCGATGFLTWAHDVCGLYMEQSGNPALLARLGDHTAGLTFGGTGLSNPMKALAGIENMAFKAKKVPGGYSVSGTLPWVSHIAKGQYCGAVAAVDHSDGSRSHEIMFLLDLDERVSLRACPEFSGMEGTSTWAITLVDYFVSEDQMIADPARPFIQRIRGAFVLLQVGIAAGIIQGSIDSMRAVEPTLGHVNQYLHNRPDELQAEFDDLVARTMVLAKTPYEGSKEFFLDVLDVRSQGAELCLKASQSSLLHQGAKGYLMSAAPQRRIREAHFVAIVTPAIKHLRWEMAKQMREEVPA